MKQSEKDMAESEKAMKQSEKDMAQSAKDMEQSKKDMEQSEKDMEQSRILQEKIIENFISENIIKNKKELYSYKLNADELIVNGIKQPETIHKKFKDRYVKSNSWMIIYEPGGILLK
jgi:multidrug resistance efflux pump